MEAVCLFIMYIITAIIIGRRNQQIKQNRAYWKGYLKHLKNTRHDRHRQNIPKHLL
jgi:hypothetical protein